MWSSRNKLRKLNNSDTSEKFFNYSFKKKEVPERWLIEWLNSHQNINYQHFAIENKHWHTGQLVILLPIIAQTVNKRGIVEE